MSTVKTQAESKAENDLVAVRKDVSEKVLNRINLFVEAGELILPPNYAVQNAIRSAWLLLQDVKDKNGMPALSVVTADSIANSMLKMAVMGLSVIKKQGSFIVYGNELRFQEEYAGNIALAKRYGGLKKIKANAIFKGDVFKFEVDPETGARKLVEHTQTLESFGSLEVQGAYAVVEMIDGTKDLEIMNIAQITAAWLQNPYKSLTPAHKKFPDQQAIKTVINRACKLLIRTSDDSAIMMQDDDETQESLGQKTEDVTFQEVKIDEVNAIPESKTLSISSNAESKEFVDIVEVKKEPVKKAATERLAPEQNNEAKVIKEIVTEAETDLFGETQASQPATSNRGF